VRVLDPGGPKKLFPYLESRLAGVYLSGALRDLSPSRPIAHPLFR
jgi:hypothetical protein